LFKTTKFVINFFIEKIGQNFVLLAHSGKYDFSKIKGNLVENFAKNRPSTNEYLARKSHYGPIHENSSKFSNQIFIPKNPKN
jgi:hypothetical protein